MARYFLCVLFLASASSLVACGETKDTNNTSQNGAPSDAFKTGVEGLLDDYNLASIGVGVVKDNQVLFTAAYGLANADTDATANANTIYAMASCSKPIVGLAVARLMELHPEFDLDADISTYLGWSSDLVHPDHPNAIITTRQLLRHESGISSDAPFDYDTYPKPDPDTPLDDFLKTYVLDSDAYWETFEPGSQYAYSNLGAALAGLVVEKVSGKSFSQFCNDELFTPLGMNDTRWLFNEYSAEQQARVARPHDEDLTLYEHYAFNDYPSGLLRTTPNDFVRLLIALSNDGDYNGTRVLKAESVASFQSVPMLIDNEGGIFSHDGGESGVNTHFRYQENGTGYVYMINSDLSDGDLDALQTQLNALIDAELR